MPRTAQQTVHIAAYDGLADWECALAVAHIRNPRFQSGPPPHVLTVAASDAPVTTMGGARVLPDVDLDDVDPTASAMLILPGADMFLAAETEEVARWGALAGRFVATGTPVAAICGATRLLASRGILDDTPHTSNAPVVLEHPRYRGTEHYVARPAVTGRTHAGGSVITATGTAPVHFAREILDVLDLYRPHTLDAWFDLYTTREESAYARLLASVA
jgi:putative intracellular protease/amidase